MTTCHDPTRGDCCGCPRCNAERLAALALSRQTSATQASLWHPRSRRLRLAAQRANTEATTAIERLASVSG